MLKKLIIFIILLALVVSLCLTAADIYLKPLVKEKLLNALEDNLGKGIELAEVDIGLLRGIVYLKGIRVKDIRAVQYNCSVAAEEIILDVDLPFTILKRNLIFQSIFLKNLSYCLDNRERFSHPSSKATPLSHDVSSVDTVSPRGTTGFGALHIKRLLIEDSEFIFEDYSITPSPSIIEIVGINGRVEDLFIPLSNNGAFKGIVHLGGQLNSEHEGFVTIDGPFARDKDVYDFNLNINLDCANLIRFSPYYSRTSFTILKKAKLNLLSSADCRQNRLNAVQKVRIYDIELDDAEARDQDMLFGLPAKTVIKFFKGLEGNVEFGFNIVGTINDPQFDYGPLIKQVLSDALRDKIIARLRELPREVIKMSEKAIKESLESGDNLQDIEKKIKDAEKKLKKIIDY